MSGGAERCDNCGKPIGDDEQKYIMKIQMYASPDPPVITEEHLEGDLIEKMEELVEQLMDMDPQEVEDQVFEQFEFTLCPSCRSHLHEGFKNNPGKQQFF